MHALAAYVMRGRIQAWVAVLGLGLLSLVVPLISVLSSAALGLVALRLGHRESAWVLVVALGSACLLGILFTGAWLPALIYGLVLWVPIWLLALLLRFCGQLTLTLEVATVIAMLGVGLTYVFLTDPSRFWQEAMEHLAQPMLERANPGFVAEQMHQGIESFSHYLTGVAAAGALSSLILGLLLARWQQSLLFNPGGSRAEFVALRLHRKLASAGLVLLIVALTAGGMLAEIAWNLFIPFAVLSFFAGLALAHALSTNANRFWLVGLYVTLFILPQATVPLALLGMSDAWLDWRARLAQETSR